MRPWDPGPLLERLDQLVGGGDPILLASDFDGTLAPLASSPDAARLPADIDAALARITKAARLRLMIISGRSLNDLRRRIHAPAILAGNHGLEIEGPGFRFVHQGAAALQADLDELCAALEQKLARWRGVLIERKGLTATVHFRNVEARFRGAIKGKVRACVKAAAPLIEWRPACEALEIFPRVYWTKASAINWLRAKLGLRAAPCICLGDDLTDESMFRNCSPALTIAVGTRRRTAARFRVPDSEAVCQVLCRLADLLALACNRETIEVDLAHAQQIY